MSVRARTVGSLGEAVRESADRRARGASRRPGGQAYHEGGGEGPGPPVTSLTELQTRILAFERSSWRSPGAKERAILDEFGLTPTRYYQLLNELIDSAAAAQFDPALVARLRRRRAERGRLRSGRDG